MIIWVKNMFCLNTVWEEMVKGCDRTKEFMAKKFHSEPSIIQKSII